MMTLLVVGLFATPLQAEEYPRIDNFQQIDEFKEAFIKAVHKDIRPRVKEIKVKRDKLIEIISRGVKSIPIQDKVFIKNLSESYQTKEDDFDGLLRRVDALPEGLLVAIIIHHTNWGTSDQYKEKNNIFNIKQNSATFDSYDSTDNALRAFIDQVNTAKEYRRLRAERARLRSIGRLPESQDILRYFVPQDDIENVMRIISQEKLYYLD